MKYAAQMNTLRAYCGTTEDACQTLHRVKALGFDGVEWNFGLLKGLDRGKIAKTQEALGLETSCLLSPFARCGFGMEDMIRDAEIFNCRNVGIGFITASFFNAGPGGVSQYMEKAQAACQTLKNAGLNPVYDLQHHEFMRLKDGSWIFEKLLSLDAQWEVSLLSMVQTGMDPQEILLRLKGKLYACRLSDQKLRENLTYFFFVNREECPLGEGVLSVDACADCAEKLGAQWLTLGQDLCDRDPFECLRVSLAYARTL